MRNWHQATSNIHSIIGKGFLKNKLLVAYCLLHIALLFTSCGVSKSSFSPYHKFSPQELQKDYTIYHSGDSMIIDPMGEVLYTKKDEEDIFTITLDKEHLQSVREKLPFLKDADGFMIINDVDI